MTNRASAVSNISRETQAVLSRPSASPEIDSEAMFAKAGAPATRATARFTQAVGATPANSFLTSTPTTPPSSAPSATAIVPLAQISRGIRVRAMNGSDWRGVEDSIAALYFAQQVDHREQPGQTDGVESAFTVVHCLSEILAKLSRWTSTTMKKSHGCSIP